MMPTTQAVGIGGEATVRGLLAPGSVAWSKRRRVPVSSHGTGSMALPQSGYVEALTANGYGRSSR
ncbi:hypothetical protein EV130_106373 [Rhizobium azibense]|uniref:Uncharacterized protein n=1 Tax=Rhizobium azibense TaxID=1136135 RepID=A0A4R3QR85_9HYPH|nr:hypothetical protein EV130_106373 [Rhizobium azibense]TCU39526.1 hypothetical protein EV129_103373 [Rhizobium azibense]